MSADIQDCPMHSTDGLYKAVAQNRRNLGLPPQDCTCDPGTESTICRRYHGGRHWFRDDACVRCGTKAPHRQADQP